MRRLEMPAVVRRAVRLHPAGRAPRNRVKLVHAAVLRFGREPSLMQIRIPVRHAVLRHERRLHRVLRARVRIDFQSHDR
ncbi:hypothetical protein D3C84_1231370 [compost metagenome]